MVRKADRAVMTRVWPWLALGILCAACCFVPPSSAGTPGPVAGTPVDLPTTPPIVVSDVCDVEDAFQANELAASRAYPPGALMDVTFRLDNVAVSLGDAVLHPRRCIFTMLRLQPIEASYAAGLHPGDAVHLRCRMDPYMLAVSMSDCRRGPP